MSGPEDHDTDAELRALVRSTDPAVGLPPADPAATNRLLEEIMSDHRPTTLGRPAAAWLAVAAACVLLLGVGFATVWQPWQNDPAPTATDTTGTEAPSEGAEPSEEPGEAEDGADGEQQEQQEPQVTTLQPPEQVAARCAVLSPRLIADNDTAFLAEATGITNDVVTLEVRKVYAGDPGDEIRIKGLVGDGVRSRQTIGVPRLQLDQRYLMASSDGVLAPCGISGPETDKLTRMYEKAFGDS